MSKRVEKQLDSFKYKGDGTLWPPLVTDKNYNIGKYAVEKKADYPPQENPFGAPVDGPVPF